ncbi:thioesterase domain-containing protein, partial [Streptomyces sp. NPDC054786]
LPALSLAWGLWDTSSGMAGDLADADRRRLDRSGVREMSTTDGLSLLDAASASGLHAVVPIHLDLRALSSADEVPPLFRGLVRRAPHRAVTSSGSAPAALRHRLTGLDAAERERELLALVLRRAAALLGHSSPEAVDTQQTFLEAGFDSLSAVELRNGLQTDLAVPLSPMAVFDSGSPEALARRLSEEVTTQPAGLPPSGTEGADTVSELFRDAVRTGDSTSGFALLRAVADLRPRFASAAELGAAPAPVRIADGPNALRLICLSTPMATGGMHQHARLAAHFRGVRPVSTLPTPGFTRGDSLPGSVDALVAVLAEGVLAAAQGDPYVLFGYSSGGLLAYATAAHLERLGAGPAGVVLVDTYRVSGSGVSAGFFHQMAVALVEQDAEFGLFDSTGLSAMTRYFDLLPTFSLDPVEAPVLFLAADRSFMPAGEATGDDEWRATPWHPEHTLRTVPATHFTIIEDDAEPTAALVEEWLDTLSPIRPTVRGV